MYKTIRPQDVRHKPAHIPAYLHIWQDENSGIAALLQAAEEIISGKIVTFALCERDSVLLTPIVKEIVSIGMGADAPRFCGENKEPEGAGSHSLIPSWYDHCQTHAAIAVALALSFKKFQCYFLLGD